jgi:hypothetical protein
MHKIILNSAPRTGLAWLQFVLSEAAMSDRSINDANVLLDNFIIRNHIPVMLLAKFEDIKQCFVLRNPIDLIPSIVTKTMGGFGTNVIGGINMPHEYNNVDIDMFVNNQFEEYERYAECLLKNIDNIIPLTFEQITNDISFVTKNVIGNEISNQMIPDLIIKAKNSINMHDKGHAGFNNFLPTDEKPKVYYEIKDKVLAHHKLNYISFIYSSVHKQIIDLQNKRNYA